MRLYKKTILSVSALLIFAAALPGAAADSRTATIDADLNVLDAATHAMKITLVEASDVANDGRVLLGTAVPITVETWVFDRNGESDITGAPTIQILAADGTDVTPAISDDTAAQGDADGFKLFSQSMTLAPNFDAGVYDVVVTVAGVSQTLSLAAFETVQWAIEGGSVSFGDITGTSTDMDGLDTVSIVNRGTSAFDVSLTAGDFTLVGGSATIPVAENLKVAVDDGAFQTLDSEASLANFANVATSLDGDGNVVPKTIVLSFQLADATPDASNVNSILPRGPYQSTFNVLVTASGAGDFAYSKNSGDFDYSGEPPVSAWANDATDPDGQGDLTFPDGF